MRWIGAGAIGSVALLAAACGTDVLLGGATDGGGADAGRSDAGADTGGLADAPADVPGDAPMLTPFPDGEWTLAIEPASSMTMCTEALAGREAEFTGITRDSLGLVGGMVDLRGVDATHVEVSGPPIPASFRGEPSIVLERGGGGPPVPPDTWGGLVTLPGTEDGPGGTVLIAFFLDVAETAITPALIPGRVSVAYVDLSMEGQCFLAFDFTWTR